MRMVNHGHATRLQPPAQHATEPNSHSTGYRHSFKALMIKRIVEKTLDSHHEKKKKHTDTPPNNTRPLTTPAPAEGPLQANCQSDKKTQSVLGLSLAHVHQAAGDLGLNISKNQGPTFISPPCPCPKAETEQGRSPLTGYPESPSWKEAGRGQT